MNNAAFYTVWLHVFLTFFHSADQENIFDDTFLQVLNSGHLISYV